MPPDADHRGGQGLGVARPRGRWLPHRRQMGLHAQRRAGEVSGSEHRRGRAGHVQRSPDRRARPALDPRRRHHRGLRHRRAPGLCLHPRRVLPGRQTLDQGYRRRLSARLPGQEHPGQRLRPGRVGASRRGRVHLRRRDRHDRVAGGQARRAAAQAALSRAAGAVGPADPGAKRRDAGQHPAHRPARRGVVRRHRHGAKQGAQSVLHQRPREPARQLRTAAGHAAARNHL